ncbi:MAG TPA: superoxide dismutase family protein [Daejeonella sp.]|nr:superoxide dismutase family protein [Daejeonella sp.]
MARKVLTTAIGAIVCLVLSLMFIQASSNQNKKHRKRAEAIISATDPKLPVSGTVKFEQWGAGQVKMVLDVTVPSRANQMVAVHIHEHAMCGNAGADAHAHWNPTNQHHGKWGSDSFHLGDIGNVELDSKGKGHFVLETNLWTIGGDSTKNVLNHSIIVHGGVDDYKTDPAGNSGPRIGCGIIVAKK